MTSCGGCGTRRYIRPRCAGRRRPSAMRVIRTADCRRMPWKNGRGETTEIAVSPPGAGLDDFQWRVSVARVARNGPVSSFEGVGRTLAILDGAGLRLDGAGRA